MNTSDSLFGQKITIKQFLMEYWQKKPLLMRQAIPGFHSPVSPESLAGLACEEMVESRLVIEKEGERPWQLKHGPFVDNDFLTLPESHWTLLVQEAHKHIPELSALLSHFDFLPRWWFDDVMISYAPDYGTVGPHFDYYDVFLFQVQGKKRWQINSHRVTEENFIADIDLRIMRDFEVEHDWVLEPGDMLYLPPGVAHYGVAMGPSLTYSIGYRALSKVEMIASFMEHTIEGMAINSHLAVDNLVSNIPPGEISGQVLANVSEIINQLPLSDEKISRWFGRFVTEPKGSYELEIPEVEINAEILVEQLGAGIKYFRSESSRFNFIRHKKKGVYLFIDGEEYKMAQGLAGLAMMLCNQTHFSAADLCVYINNKEAVSLLVNLYNQGKIYRVEDSSVHV